MKNKDNRLIYTINGKEYLLVERIVVNDDYESESEQKQLAKIGAIEQGVKITVRTRFSKTFGTARYLIPTKNIDKYRKITKLRGS